jgi:hypothetical protein
MRTIPAANVTCVASKTRLRGSFIRDAIFRTGPVVHLPPPIPRRTGCAGHISTRSQGLPGFRCTVVPGWSIRSLKGSPSAARQGHRESRGGARVSKRISVLSAQSCQGPCSAEVSCAFDATVPGQLVASPRPYVLAHQGPSFKARAAVSVAVCACRCAQSAAGGGFALALSGADGAPYLRNRRPARHRSACYRSSLSARPICSLPLDGYAGESRPTTTHHTRATNIETSGCFTTCYEDYLLYTMATHSHVAVFFRGAESCSLAGRFDGFLPSYPSSTATAGSITIIIVMLSHPDPSLSSFISFWQHCPTNGVGRGEQQCQPSPVATGRLSSHPPRHSPHRRYLHRSSPVTCPP